MTLPELHLADWRPTKDTLHLYCQIVGKVRLASTPPRNHWWNVSDQPLPVGEWADSGNGSLAVLPYDLVRTSRDPRETLLAFLQGAYEAGARLAGWDTSDFESHQPLDAEPRPRRSASRKRFRPPRRGRRLYLPLTCALHAGGRRLICSDQASDWGGTPSQKE